MVKFIDLSDDSVIASGSTGQTSFYPHIIGTDTEGNGTKYSYCGEIRLGPDGYETQGSVQTNTLFSGTIPEALMVYGRHISTAGTSITIDVSEDGGSSWGVTEGNFDEPIYTDSFTGSDIALKFNLHTTDSSVTPEFYGYGVTIVERN